MHSDVSNFYLFLKDYSDQLPKEYSFLSGKWAEHQQWRTMAQSKVFELLGYFPSATPLDSMEADHGQVCLHEGDILFL